MTENFGPTDLLGDPLRPLPSKRGRRKLRFPEEIYEKIEVLAADNLSQEEIADAVGISVPTLTKYFRHELKAAHSRRRAKLLERLDAASEKGNVAATKALLSELGKQRAVSAMRDRERQAPAQPAPRKGVKEERQAAAATVVQGGGKYAPPEAPRLAVVRS